MSEEEKEAIEIIKYFEQFTPYIVKQNTIGSGTLFIDHELNSKIKKLLKLYNKEKERADKLQRENEELKNEKEPAGEFFMSKNGIVIKVIDNREEKER